jgi:sirohydrochlorin ferrochelatase
MKSNDTAAVVLIAHGSREPAANSDVHHLAAQLRERGPYVIVEAAFLELAEPTIDGVVEVCAQKGATTIILVPAFLSAGVHVTRDLAEAQKRLSALHRDVRFILAEPLGRHPLLVELILERTREAYVKL